MPVRAVDDKPSDTLVVVSGEGFWTGSSTLPHLHQLARQARASTATVEALEVWRPVQPFLPHDDLALHPGVDRAEVLERGAGRCTHGSGHRGGIEEEERVSGGVQAG